MQRTVRFANTFAHPPAILWKVLTDRHELAEWLMENDFAPVVGHRFTFRTERGSRVEAQVRCEVLAIEPQRLLSFSWRTGAEEAPLIDTVVTLRLTPKGTGTRIELEQSGFSGMQAVTASFMLGGAWKAMLGRNGSFRRRIEGLATRPGMRA